MDIRDYAIGSTFIKAYMEGNTHTGDTVYIIINGYIKAGELLKRVNSQSFVDKSTGKPIYRVDSYFSVRVGSDIHVINVHDIYLNPEDAGIEEFTANREEIYREWFNSKFAKKKKLKWYRKLLLIFK